ncbi:hypothetical protein K488DRAFT_76131 [Vararia minispora EC-137]|uniref:Uncharacterized protein n=1 Tax=Vararia minispora EC-137 TaxID=1314806 RepID=A0ACB8QX49_9AGAM|nr:hypothetical protein K488DRAFT_76131 [Vararia minispora EC-137]
MSLSPPIRRLSSSSVSKREEDLINAYEAEEERIINVLSRKLEKVTRSAAAVPRIHLQEEKIELENVLEAESESHVNRLSKELSALRLAQMRAQQANGAPITNGEGVSHDTAQAAVARLVADPMNPSSDTLLESMRRENETLRNRLVDTEREYIRISRLNEVYREELIELRNRLGLPVDQLIGLLPAHDPFSQPTHHRRRAPSHLSSPVAAHPFSLPPTPARAGPAPMPVPIPRPPSQIHRPGPTPPSSGSPSAPSSAESPYLSPLAGTNPASYISTGTRATTPPSSGGGSLLPPAPRPVPPLSYPSVPPPSLSSSFGSPRASAAGSRSPRGSVERGFRVAETGTLLPRSRRSSVAANGAEA